MLGIEPYNSLMQYYPKYSSPTESDVIFPGWRQPNSTLQQSHHTPIMGDYHNKVIIITAWIYFTTLSGYEGCGVLLNKLFDI